MQEFVILVDEHDSPIGEEEKMEAHRKGLLHRAFSVFIFNSKDELMLQQRALTKYHCPGLWTNTVCSHPRRGESNEAAARRRLQEEMGFDAELKELFSFTYKVPFPNGLTEHEFDHVFIGKYDADPVLNRDEAESWKWISLGDLKEGIEKNPDQYTAWLKICFNELLEKLPQD